MCSSTRGPATPPSLVTWPTRNTARSPPVEPLLARCMSASPHSRTCVTEPGPPSRSARARVWIESTISTSGAVVRAASRTASRSVSHSTNSAGGIDRCGPRARTDLLLALLLTRDDQHLAPRGRQHDRELQQQRALADARVTANQHQRAGNDPPPSTRSNSASPVGLRSRPRAPGRRRAEAACAVHPRRRAPSARWRARGRARGGRFGGGVPRSAALHRPNQRGSSCPHAEQKKCVFGGRRASSHDVRDDPRAMTGVAESSHGVGDGTLKTLILRYFLGFFLISSIRVLSDCTDALRSS